MMSNTEYSEFRKKINPIIKDCTVVSEHKPGLATCPGLSTFTQSSKYVFDKATVQKYHNELLDICKSLPKLDSVIPGSACSISALHIIKGSENPVVLKSQFEAAEKFMYLLNICLIGGVRSVTSENGLTYTIVDIIPEFKNRVLS